MLKILKPFVTLLCLLSAPAFAGPLACNVTADAPVTLLATQPTGQVSDVVITCSGGTPAEAGVLIPTENIALFLSVTVVSSSTPRLFVNGPVPGTELLCSDTYGCPILGTSGASNPYDGSPGRPNVFLGTLWSGWVYFLGIPFDAPGDSEQLIMRLSGASIGLSPGPLVPIQAFFSISGSIPMDVTGTIQTVAFAEVGQVPEPSTLSLAAMAFGALAWRARGKAGRRG